jgi:hypothetical protein
MWRWFAWVNWAYILPMIGLLTVAAVFAGFVFWQVLGQEKAYQTTQTWIQNQFGAVNVPVDVPIDVPVAAPAAVSQATASDNAKITSADFVVTEPAQISVNLGTTLQLTHQLRTPTTKPESPKP